jgi:hypothetical protein
LTPTVPHGSRSFGPENPCDGAAQTPPLIRTGGELIAAHAGNPIEARPAIGIGSAPFRFDPLTAFEALEGGIQRTVIDEQRSVGLLLNRAGDALPVLVTEGQDAQNEEIERSLEKRDAFTIVLGSHST